MEKMGSNLIWNSDILKKKGEVVRIVRKYVIFLTSSAHCRGQGPV